MLFYRGRVYGIITLVRRPGDGEAEGAVGG